MTVSEIKAAKMGDTIWDDRVKGLHLRALPTKKAFYLAYRTLEGTRRKPKIGVFPLMTIAQARQHAQTILTAVMGGEDPGNPGPDSRTIHDLYGHYLKIHAVKQQPNTVREYARIYENYILGAIGTKKLNEVTEQDCIKLYHDLYKTPVQANRMISILKASFNLAEDWGWIPRHSNPVHVKLESEEARERYPDPQEAARLIRALEETEIENPIFAYYVWLLLLTGARPGEILKAKWEWVTPIGIVLPKAKRRKKGRVIALSQAAREILHKLPHLQRNPYLFPGRREGLHLSGTQFLWQDLLDKAQVSGLQIRDLRRYFASLVLSEGASLDQVGQLLGHTQVQTTRRYAYLMIDVKQKAVEAVSTKLENLKTQGKIPGK